MAKIPAGVEREPDQSPSRNGEANQGGVVIALSASAERHAACQGIIDAVGALRLGVDCMVGDLVTLAHEGVEHHFCILRRRWVEARGDMTLEITLDHPART